MGKKKPKTRRRRSSLANTADGTKLERRASMLDDMSEEDDDAGTPVETPESLNDLAAPPPGTMENIDPTKEHIPDNLLEIQKALQAKIKDQEVIKEALLEQQEEEEERLIEVAEEEEEEEEAEKEKEKKGNSPMLNRNFKESQREELKDEAGERNLLEFSEEEEEEDGEGEEENNEEGEGTNEVDDIDLSFKQELDKMSKGELIQKMTSLSAANDKLLSRVVHSNRNSRIIQPAEKELLSKILKLEDENAKLKEKQAEEEKLNNLKEENLRLQKLLEEEKLAREKEAREKEAKERLAKEKEAEEKEIRDKESRDKEAKEKEALEAQEHKQVQAIPTIVTEEDDSSFKERAESIASSFYYDLQGFLEDFMEKNHEYIKISETSISYELQIIQEQAQKILNQMKAMKRPNPLSEESSLINFEIGTENSSINEEAQETLSVNSEQSGHETLSIHSEQSSQSIRSSVSEDQETSDNKELIRKHIVIEMKQTEDAYVSQLRHLINGYMVELVNLKFQYTNEWKEILKHLTGIVTYNQMLMNLISEREKDWGPNQKIGDVFITASQHLSHYSAYINNYSKVLTVFHQCQAIPAFEAKCQEIYASSKIRLTLNDLLIIPIQRIPRYVLLLESLQKKTRTSHPDYSNIEQALQMMKETAKEIDKKKGEAMKLEALNELQLKLINYPSQVFGNLPQTERSLILEADVMEKVSGGLKERRIFLFNDFIMSTKASTQGFFKSGTPMYEVKWYYFLHVLIPPEKAETNYAGKIVREGDSTAIALEFSSGTENDIRTLVFSKQEDLLTWNTTIKQTYDDLERRETQNMPPQLNKKISTIAGRGTKKPPRDRPKTTQFDPNTTPDFSNVNDKKHFQSTSSKSLSKEKSKESKDKEQNALQVLFTPSTGNEKPVKGGSSSALLPNNKKN